MVARASGRAKDVSRKNAKTQSKTTELCVGNGLTTTRRSRPRNIAREKRKETQRNSQSCATAMHENEVAQQVVDACLQNPHGAWHRSVGVGL